MSSIFYPVLPLSCPWGAQGACRFCGIPFMEKVLTEQLPTNEELFLQFDNFVSDEKNWEAIQRHKRIAIAPNGSVVPEVPRVLRQYILKFCSGNGFRFESELIATLVDKEKSRLLYQKAFSRWFRGLSKTEIKKRVDATILEIEEALNKEFPGRNVLLNTGLEVADEEDLQLLHNYTESLNDYLKYAAYLRERDIGVGANVLVGAPMIENPVYKAFKTIRFAFEEMKADKVLLIVWVPTKYTVAKKMYDQGKIDVLSATEAAEIYQIARRTHPDKEIEYNPMRAYVYHGKHPNFRSSQINTDKRKGQVRENVRNIAKGLAFSV